MYAGIAEGAKALGLDPKGLEAAGRAIEREMAAGVIPGAVMAVTRHGKEWVYAAGSANPGPDHPLPAGPDVLYDCASLTKVSVTLPLVLGLIDDGVLTLGTKAAAWIPEFTGEGREEVTIGQLLTHTSGLPSDRNIHAHGWTQPQMWEAVTGVALQHPPGTAAVYSDLGFLLLGRIVEKAAGMPLDQAAKARIWEPLGMAGAVFAPPAGLRVRTAPTEYDRAAGGHLQGVVHDEKARALGGVCGHAGLFATAGDLARYARMWLAGGAVPEPTAPGGQPQRVLSAAAVRAATRTHTAGIAGANRGLGWVLKGDRWDASGDWMGPRSYGHTGFTGTSLWMEPDLDLAVVLLTNRVYYGRSGSVGVLRAAVHNSITAAVRD